MKSDISQFFVGSTSCVIKFLQKWEKLMTETFDALKKVFGESTMSQTAVFWWYQLFWDSFESVDDEHSSYPSSTNATGLVGRVRVVVIADQRLSVQVIAAKIGETEKLYVVFYTTC